MSHPVVVRRRDPTAVASLLAGVPGWFGIPEANAAYVSDAGRLTSYLAIDGDEVVGVALLAEHFPEARELHLLVVRRDRHRQGIGRLLVDTVASDLRLLGVRLLEVHTVGPSHEDVGYARTRMFYVAQGFVPMTELQGIDWSGPTLILVRPL